MRACSSLIPQIPTIFSSFYSNNSPGGPDLGPIGDFYQAFVNPGVHEIVAVPFDSPGCEGTPGCPLVETFRVECSPCPGNITGFTLIDAITNAAIAPLSDFNYDSLPTTSLNIRAEFEECDTGGIESVQFFYDGAFHSCENWTPYALDGDKNPDGPDLGLSDPVSYYRSDLAIGEHTIVAVPWDDKDCTGSSGCPFAHTFHVAYNGCPGFVSGFSLWSSRWQSKLMPLTNSQVVCRSQARGKLAIQAETVSCAHSPVAKVTFGGDFSGTDKSADYFAPRNKNLPLGATWIKGKKLRPGTYVVSATPYSSGGDEGLGMSISFQIAKC